MAKEAKIQRMDGNSLSPQKELAELLKAQFPQIFAEGKVNPDKLKQALGEDLDTNNERYGLSWAGKAECFRHIQETTTATLKLVRGQSVDFDKTENIFIEGDNLEVLKILQKTYQNKIKMIYIDPPYNTGNDSFIYPDRYKEEKDDYEFRAGIKDAEGLLTKDGFWRKNSKDAGHFHSNWLSMMYPRLFLAKNLLREDGILFISIDENELHNLRLILDEIFGAECFAGEFIWNTRHSQQQGLISVYHEKILVYTKMESNLYPNFFSGNDNGDIIAGAMKKISKGNPASDFEFPAGIRCEAKDGTIFSGKWGDKETVELINGQFVVEGGKTKYPMILRAGWTQKNQMQEFYYGTRPVYDTKEQVVKEFFFTSAGKLKSVKEKSRTTPSSILDQFGTVSHSTKLLAELLNGDYFERPKPVSLIRYLIELVLSNSEDENIVMDFFAGSCTTAHAIYEYNLNNKGKANFLCVQLAEPCDESTASGKNALNAGFKTIADIGKERIRRAGKKIKEENKGKLDFDGKKLDLGFKVFRLEESNFKQWRENVKTGEELKEQMRMFVDNVKKGAASDDMLFEIILKNSRFDLNAKIEKETFDGADYYVLADGLEIICLAEKITKKLVEKILKDKPERFTCLDIAFKNNDQLKTNTALQMESAKIEFKVI